MMRQVENIGEIFEELFTKYIPDRIIELGTGHGEFTQLIYDLRKEINEDFKLITFDIGEGMEIIRPNLIFCRCDIFNNLNLIKELIVENTLILCDNGDKVNEMRTIIPALKPNCVVMAHDFGGQECWGWEEIRLKNVFDLIETYELELFHQELMLRGAWLSLIKNR